MTKQPHELATVAYKLVRSFWGAAACLDKNFLEGYESQPCDKREALRESQQQLADRARSLTGQNYIENGDAIDAGLKFIALTDASEETVQFANDLIQHSENFIALFEGVKPLETDTYQTMRANLLKRLGQDIKPDSSDLSAFQKCNACNIVAAYAKLAL